MATPVERAYSALHEDYSNGLMSRQEYEAAFAQLRAPAPRRRRGRRLLAWLLIGAVVLAALALYAAQIGAL
jgi:uncharacterized membrane protein